MTAWTKLTIPVALIVVDTTRKDWNRYGVVILSEHQKPRSVVEIKWLFRDRDLSQVKLGWSSGDTLGIAEYRDDGSYRHCFVKWDAKNRRYVCNLRQFKLSNVVHNPTSAVSYRRL